MNYSVFKLQNQAGRPAIFWEKETVPKKDRKFGYKTATQRFPVRRYADDRHHVDTDLVTLTPDEPPPPPKPSKNFIQRNRKKVAAKKSEANSTVTLTQEQLNAILKSVGKVAGGSENAVKITVDKHNDTKEIVVESPRRHERNDEDYDDNEYDDRRERRRKKKSDRKPEDQGDSIYSLLDNKSKTKASSDNESVDSDASLELRRLTKQYKKRKDRKSRRQEEADEDEDRYVRDKNRRNKNSDLEDEDNLREKRNRRNRSNNLQDEIDKELNELRKWNKKHKDNDDDSDYEKENRRRRARSKRLDSEDEDLDRGHDRRDRDRKSERTKKDDSRERHTKKTRNKSEERELDVHNTSVNKDEEGLIPSPRDKIGLPIDLSWKHMTKAERRRLEIARQKAVDEEERKEEERIKQLNAQYDPEESFKKAPRRHQPTRSDPPATRQTRYDRGRETETTNYTDGNRHGRRSRSPSDQRTPERSPELPSYTTPDVSPKAPIGVPRRHMTLAEKKRQEWERERVESVQVQRGGGDYDPWGRPGAGAPLRTRSGHVVADYKGRQDQMHNEPIPEEEPAKEKNNPHEQGTRHSERRVPARGRSPPPAQSQSQHTPRQGQDTNVPVTMRSSFILGQAAPDYDRLVSAKERERKKWLADLEKQIEEKRQLGTKHFDSKEETTWADKLGQSYRPAPFPEQPKETIDKLNTSTDYGKETNRVQSAPDDLDHGSHIRGQNAPMDPVTKKELEDKRKRYLEHQEAVKAQVEEKERQKRQERERKMKEDMEEERKLQVEREMLQRQFDMEQQKTKQKEQQRQAQVNQLKAAMDEAQAKALQEKYQRKMQHLEAGGHDTTKLREHLEGELTSRIEQLNTRRERDIQKARHLLEMQHWGVTIEEEDEQNESQIKDELPSNAKITPREDGITVVEPSHIPGLDLSTARTQLPPQMPTTRRDQQQVYGQGQPQGQFHGHYSQAQSNTNEPYTENRVLTPSQYRHSSKPWSDQGSPHREFGTQTGNLNASASDLDGDDLSELLNPRLHRDYSEVNIEYKYEKGKKVRVISAPKDAIEKRSRKPKQPHPPPSQRDSSRSPHEHHHEVKDKIDKEEERRKKRLEVQRRKGPVKPGSRPMWGYKNADSKKPKKQSERDPFYEQKKRESDMRRMKREQKLLAMVEANKPVIPDYYVPPPRSSRSKSRDPSPFSDIEMASPREVRLNRRSKSHSPNRQVLHGETDNFHDHRYQNERSGDRGRHRSKSSPRRDDFSQSPKRTGNDHYNSRHVSPPVPALRHRTDTNQNQNDSERGRKGGKYGDADPLDVPIPNGDFVPFTRTVDILDPTKAEEPLPLSREATRVANARRAYYEGLHPEKFGYRQYNIQDKHRVLPTNDDKNPLVNPSLVLDHPTTRQDQILVQLSTLKQSLMQRQRELETFSPTDLVRMDTDIRA